MNSPGLQAPHPAPQDRRPPGATPRASVARRLALALLALAVAAAYAGSFAGAFVYDDVPAILENPTIRHLGRLGEVLAPPGDQAGTVGGRPVVNLSLALNVAISGTAPWSYHAFNLAVHLAAAALLFGIVARTLDLPAVRGERPWPEKDRIAVAFAVAILWALHPLQTEAVTYVVQRAESLMGMLYLLTVYCFVRGAGAGVSEPGRPAAGPGPAAWFVLAWLACLLGMATKEVMVTAPVLALLYDRTFLAGSFREAWRRRRGIHLALASTWVLLAVLVAGTGGRGGSAGFGSHAGVWPSLDRFL